MSAQTKHTPGPWIHGPFGEVWPASDVEFIDGKWREKCAEPRIIASPIKRLPEAEANARLIAAAPDLLEALRRCRRWMPLCNGDQTVDADKAFADAVLAALDEAR